MESVDVCIYGSQRERERESKVNMLQVEPLDEDGGGDHDDQGRG